MSTSLDPVPSRGAAWRWWVCGLLLLATMLNYMDRLTLNLTAVRIMYEFGLDARDYGQLESAFAFAFALGAIVFGWLADRYSVGWLYLVAVLGWSVAGFATGAAHGFLALLACRFFLGLFEAGNWPSALRTTQHILPPAQRTFGNGILQSGAALGAVVTPVLIAFMISRADPVSFQSHQNWLLSVVGQTVGRTMSGLPTAADLAPWLTPVFLPGAWRGPFLVIGVLGVSWAVLWLVSVRRRDLLLPARAAGPSLMSVLGWLVALLGCDVGVQVLARLGTFGHSASGQPETPWWLALLVKATMSVVGITLVMRWLLRSTADEDRVPRPLFLRRVAALAVLVTVMNLTWHFFRAWLPLFLQQERGYTEAETTSFFIAYYVSTGVGSLVAGLAPMLLSWFGVPVQRARVLVYAGCAVLCTLSLVAAWLPAGELLLNVLLVIGFATLGLFPLYYSFNQELTVRHQGKLSGALGCMNWLAMYLLHEVVGTAVKQTGSNAVGMALAGLPPLVGLAALLLLWGKDPPPKPV